MNRLFSISALFQSITALMAVTLVLTCGMSAERAFQRRQTDEQVLNIVDMSRDLFNAMQETRSQRGGLELLLASPEVLPRETPVWAAVRERQSQAVDSALAKLATQPRLAADAARIAAARKPYLAAQAEVMAALKRPLDRRPAGLSEHWAAADTALGAAMGDLARRLGAEASLDDPIVSEMMKIKQDVWWVRDAGGGNHVLLINAMTTGARPTAAQQRAADAQAGRSDEAWAMLADDARSPTTPQSLSQAAEQAETANALFESSRQTILAELAAGRPLTISRDAERAAIRQSMDSLMNVATVAFDLSEAHGRQALASDDRDLGVAVLLMLMTFGLGAFTVRLISGRVVGPIARIIDAMVAVAGGELEREVPFQGSGDEIGRLARALNVFRRNALEKRRVEDELVRSRVAVEAAEAASRLKSQFLANVSHEIRTPLNGVLGMAQVMERDELSPAQAERLGAIRDSGHALLQILNDVLDLSKIEAGEFELLPAEFDVGDLVERTVAAFSGAAEAKGLKLAAKVESNADGVWLGDAVRLRQILSNLISNAIKFTDKGEVTLVAEPCAEALCFAVHDTGIGIAAEALPKLFSKFSQLDESNTRRFGGTGLGLAISRELAQMMRGDIQVESELGAGSTFRVTVPLRRIGERASKAPAKAALPAPPTPERQVRILAAEDNATNRRVLTALLSPLGADLTIVDDGVAAIEAWRAGAFDLILMDIQMPGVSGLAAAQAIRAHEASRGLEPVPIIALSANAMSHQVDSYLAAGMSAHVAKPIDAAQLFSTIADVLARSTETKTAAPERASVA